MIHLFMAICYRVKCFVFFFSPCGKKITEEIQFPTIYMCQVIHKEGMSNSFLTIAPNMNYK